MTFKSHDTSHDILEWQNDVAEVTEMTFKSHDTSHDILEWQNDVAGFNGEINVFLSSQRINSSSILLGR